MTDPREFSAGIARHSGLIGGARLEQLCSKVDSAYLPWEASRRHGGSDPSLPAGQRFVPAVSSLTLGAVLDEPALLELLGAVAAGAGAWAGRELSGPLACDLDQAWVRRQYAPANCPPLHWPHSWHQDGALRFDFPAHLNGVFPADAVLPMVTCWVALTACGADAPGLEFVNHRIEGLVAPGDLAPDRVRARFPAEAFVRPVLEPGDALLFRGDILHRTHVTPQMTRDRTSIELRFFPRSPLPRRLNGERFADVGA